MGRSMAEALWALEPSVQALLALRLPVRRRRDQQVLEPEPGQGGARKGLELAALRPAAGAVAAPRLSVRMDRALLAGLLESESARARSVARVAAQEAAVVKRRGRWNRGGLERPVERA
jgi:hypothetical protein